MSGEGMPCWGPAPQTCRHMPGLLLAPVFPAQVTQRYSASLDRSDHSLLQYGFVQGSEAPLLAAVDHLGGGQDPDDELYSARVPAVIAL